MKEQTSDHRLQAVRLSKEGNALVLRSKSYEIGMEAENRKRLREQGMKLCRCSQQLYEEYLRNSAYRCLLVFSIESIGAQYGIGTYIKQLIQCFDREEWDVNIITLHATNLSEVNFRMEEHVAWYDFPTPEERINSNAPIHEEKYLKSIFYYWASRIGDGRKVFCHFNFPTHNLLASLFKERLRTPILFTLHYTGWSFDLLGNVQLLKYFLDQPSNNIKRVFEQEKSFMEKYCDRIITIAQHSYKMVRDIYGIPLEKIVCIPNGLQDDYKERSIEECNALRHKYHYTSSEKIIVFTGRLDIVKGIIELIKAFNEVIEVLPEARLILAGSGNFVRCLETASPCWKHITFTGYIPKEQLYELYAIADLGVVPSIHEEFGYVATEMMLNRLPIVVHNTTGLNEISDNGRYATTFSFDESRNCNPLKEAIINAINKKKTKQQKDEARNRVLNNYTIPQFQEQIKSVYACMENPYRVINNLKQKNHD